MGGVSWGKVIDGGEVKKRIMAKITNKIDVTLIVLCHFGLGLTRASKNLIIAPKVNKIFIYQGLHISKFQSGESLFGFSLQKLTPASVRRHCPLLNEIVTSPFFINSPTPTK